MIIERLSLLKEKIFSVCNKIGCSSEQINIVVVTKTISIDKIKEVVDYNIKDIGENKVQEAEEKFVQIKEKLKKNKIKFHMIGHMQTNKVKKAISMFDLIQSVDSINLAQQINVQSLRYNKMQDCLLQIKVSEEEAKFGLSVENIEYFFEKVQDFKNIRFLGIMTLAPYFENPQNTRPYFSKAKKLFDKLNNIKSNIYVPKFLSMGMSNDFEVAIEEGANMIRIGSFIFS